jgi:hypothetical protein
VHLGTIEEGRLVYSKFGGGFSRRYEIDPSGDIRFGQDAVHQVWLDGKKFFLPLGWRLSNRSIGTIGNSPAAAITTQIVQRELMGLDADDLKGRKPEPQQPK